MRESVPLSSEALVPERWRDLAGAGPVRVFNPGLLQESSGWILAYRVVLPDLARRIAICRLRSDFSVLPGSAVELTDLIRFPAGRNYPEAATTWFADPRLYRLGGHIFVYWNSGWPDYQNNQFILGLDQTSLRPIGVARELTLAGDRQRIEKNWTLFGAGPFYAVYSVSPHRILSVCLDGDGDVRCDPVFEPGVRPDEEYSREYGRLRGGSPPQLVDGGYYSFCHSVCNSPSGYRYVPAAYRFSGSQPFSPTHAPAVPLPLDNPLGPRTVHPKLNPVVGEVLYPAGAAFADGHWAISFGINDERCAIAVIPHAGIQSCLRPLHVEP
jgi:predicted GH43/DUF377 family glycosyl hydrolase